ncbi:uncharacterized protein LOC124369705 [Homalodisca vitripennis]|uniref:uncharacterized protein LOC124369705 n=1 Tax=Homalodisca vitripennis TaxID=197043 RepID=UPI001EEB9E64|nr:uncharacterized protein LOC124369705 [Homalodisca vitripennis]
MSFVLKTSTHRPSDSNIPMPDEIEEHSNHWEQQRNLSEQQDDIDGESMADDAENASEMTSTVKERRNRSPRGVDKVLAYMQNKECNKKTRAKSIPDDVDLFFASATQSVRKLPRQLQNKIKMDLLSSICRAEEQHEWNCTSACGSTSQQLFVATPSSSTITMEGLTFDTLVFCQYDRKHFCKLSRKHLHEAKCPTSLLGGGARWTTELLPIPPPPPRRP